MNVNIICIGKLKEAYWREAVAEYAKRIGGYASFKVLELPEVKLPENPSESQILQGLTEEAKKIMPYLEQKSAYNIALCIEGKQVDSPKLAEIFKTATLNGNSTVNFVIGSSFGMADSVKNACDFKLSFSPMTFPHQLARVIACEQIYRAISIINNTKYHK